MTKFIKYRMDEEEKLIWKFNSKAKIKKTIFFLSPYCLTGEGNEIRRSDEGKLRRKH